MLSFGKNYQRSSRSKSFLEKIKKLTPIQNVIKGFQRFQKYNKKQDYQILNETKNLHHKKNHFSKPNFLQSENVLQWIGGLMQFFERISL